MAEKSVFVWNVPAIAGGDPKSFVKVLTDLGVDTVIVKAANYTWEQTCSYAAFPGWGLNIKPELVSEIKAAGINFDVWHFVGGYDPVGEANIAKKVCGKFAPRHYIWNSESAFEAKTSRVANASYITRTLRSAYPDIKQSVCTWAFPLSPVTGSTWHPTDVIKAYMDQVDYATVMMYWGGESSASAVKYYEDSYTVWRKLTNKPILPVGRAYNGDGGKANAPAMTAFANHVSSNIKADNLTGVSWYSLDELVKNPTWFDAVRESGNFPPPVSELTLEEKVDRLVEHHPEIF